MRQASPWVVCLLSLVGLGFLGCKHEREAADPADLAASAEACPGGKCVIKLIESGGTCKIDQPNLYIESGFTVTFEPDVSEDTEAVDITPKRTTPLKFQGGQPSRIPSGSSFNTGPITGRLGQSYQYTATFVGRVKEPCPPIDPVICIKTGITAETCN